MRCRRANDHVERLGSRAATGRGRRGGRRGDERARRPVRRRAPRSFLSLSIYLSICVCVCVLTGPLSLITAAAYCAWLSHVEAARYARACVSTVEAAMEAGARVGYPLMVKARARPRVLPLLLRARWADRRCRAGIRGRRRQGHSKGADARLAADAVPAGPGGGACTRVPVPVRAWLRVCAVGGMRV